jgi:hypothetical protein
MNIRDKEETKRQQIYRLETETEKLINRKMTSVLPRREQRQVVLRDKKRTYPTPAWRVGGAEGPLRSRVPFLALGKGMWPCPLRVPW